MELSEEGPLSVWYMAYGGTGLTATTEQEYMKFDIDLPVDRIDLFLRIEADRMQNSIFRNFDAERMVLVEQRLGDLNGAETEFREAMNSLVGRASMVYVPEGYANDFQQYTRRYERELYETYFVPNNTTLIFIGGVTLDDMIPKVEKYFGHMERYPGAGKRYQGREPLPSSEKRLNWRSDTLSPARGSSLPDSRRRASRQATIRCAGRGFRSCILQSAVTEAGIDGTVDINMRVVHTSRFGVPASINIELVLEDASQIDKAEKRCWPSCGDLARSHLPAELVAQARKKLRTEWYRTAVDPGALAFQIGHFEVMDSWRTLKPYLEARDAATAEDLRLLADKYFIANNRSVGVVLPEEAQQ